MGYECDSRAGDTLRRIMLACEASTGDAERMRDGSRLLLWRLGPEQKDGAVVGTTYEVTADDGSRMLARPAGSFRIAPSGRLHRGPVWMRRALELRKDGPD